MNGMTFDELRLYFASHGNLPLGVVEQLLDIAEAAQVPAAVEIQPIEAVAPKKRGKAEATPEATPEVAPDAAE